jgi:beta-lactamase regulating signal transducer with metallopeptidase domain/cell division septation protein DedD
METISRYLLTFLLNSLWQIPLIAAVGALACWLVRKGPANHRYTIWVAALCAGLLLPLASTPIDKEGAPLRINVTFAPQAISSGASTANATALRAGESTAALNGRSVPYAQTTGTIVLGAYFLFLLFRLFQLAWAWSRTIQIRRAATRRSAPPLLEEVWARCLRAFGLHDVELLSSSSLSSPVTAGAWRKTIILPESFFAETSRDVLTTAIGHEMAHLARHDFGLNLLYELLYIPVSFHPAAWMMRRGIGRTREMACDELVTRQLMDAGVYARSIMSIAAGMVELPGPGYTLGVFDGDILEERIRRLMERPAANLKRARLLLAAGLSALIVCAVAASGLALSARAQSAAEPEIKLAGEAYNGGDFKSAVQHFERAVQLDPGNVNAKLFLANALMQEFFNEKGPFDTPPMASARQQYLDVLARDPLNKKAIEGLTSVDIYTKQLGEAHTWALKLIYVDPQDKAGYYTAGVVDWAMVFPELQRAKQAAGGKMEDYAIPDASVRKTLRDQYQGNVEEGLQMLQTALQLDPNYDDAMAYMNLLYRLKASLVDSASESAELMAKADDFVHQALATKRQHAHGGAPGAAQLDISGPPPGPASPRPIMMHGPPPPPPPAGPAVRDNESASAVPPRSPRNAAERPGSFVQVMGAGEISANALARALREKGFSTSFVKSSEDNLVRVMVGPYSDARSLEQAKTNLERAGFRSVGIW